MPPRPYPAWDSERERKGGGLGWGGGRERMRQAERYRGREGERDSDHHRLRRGVSPGQTRTLFFQRLSDRLVVEGHYRHASVEPDPSRKKITFYFDIYVGVLHYTKGSVQVPKKITFYVGVLHYTSEHERFCTGTSVQYLSRRATFLCIRLLPR